MSSRINEKHKTFYSVQARAHGCGERSRMVSLTRNRLLEAHWLYISSTLFLGMVQPSLPPTSNSAGETSWRAWREEKRIRKRRAPQLQVEKAAMDSSPCISPRVLLPSGSLRLRDSVVVWEMELQEQTAVARGGLFYIYIYVCIYKGVGGERERGVHGIWLLLRCLTR